MMTNNIVMLFTQEVNKKKANPDKVKVTLTEHTTNREHTGEHI